jgi:hypothetical protein
MAMLSSSGTKKPVAQGSTETRSSKALSQKVCMRNPGEPCARSPNVT